MATDKKISELPVATAPTGTELMEVVQGGVNKQLTAQDIADLGGGGNFVPLTLTADTTIDGQGNELILQGGAGEAVQFALDGVNNTQHALIYKTGGVVRWQIHTDNNETGSSNIGSDLHIERFDDAGVYIDNPIIIDRTDGVVDFNKTPTVGVGSDPLQVTVNAAVAITDAASMDLTAIKHTLTTSSATRTFTITYTGDDITIEITLNTTTTTLTFPATSLCVSDGVASGDNTCTLLGASGDKYIIAIKKIGSAYYVISKNFGQ